MDFGPQMASNWSAILPTFRELCILFHCHGFADGRQQTELSHTLPNGEQ